MRQGTTNHVLIEDWPAAVAILCQNMMQKHFKHLSDGYYELNTEVKAYETGTEEKICLLLLLSFLHSILSVLNSLNTTDQRDYLRTRLP